MDIPHSNHYLALSGGVGGAKLVLGLSGVLEPDQTDGCCEYGR